jgi:hypothetical protein
MTALRPAEEVLSQIVREASFTDQDGSPCIIGNIAAPIIHADRLAVARRVLIRAAGELRAHGQPKAAAYLEWLETAQDPTTLEALLEEKK